MDQEKSRRREPLVPRPDRLRVLAGTSFGWFDARLLREGWLGLLHLEARSLYMLLCGAANRQGVSWYSRARMGGELHLADDAVWQGLDQLERLGLVAYEPFSEHAADGFRQVLPLPPSGPPGVRARRRR